MEAVGDWGDSSGGANITELTFDYYNGTNSTEVEAFLSEEWRVVLDKVAKWVMLVTTIAFMSGMGAAITIIDVWKHTKRPVGAVIGLLGQFLLLPALGFGMSVLFKLRPYEALGVLMVSCSPGGSFSNFFTFWSDGDLALSVMMTAVSSVVALGGMPFNLWLYSRYWRNEDDESIKMPYVSIMTSLAFVMIPAILGMVLNHFHKKAAAIVTKVTSILAWVGVAASLVLWLLLYGQAFVEATPLIYLAAFLLPNLGLTFAFILGKICCRTNKVARTIGIETGCQNMPVALSVILLSFQDPEIKSQMVLFPSLYGVLLSPQAILLIVIFQLYVRKCAKKSNDDYPVAYTAKLEKGESAEKAALTMYSSNNQQ